MGKSKRRLKKRLNRSRQRKGQKGRNRHHLTARSKKGRSVPSNLLLIDIEKHKCWHTLFKLKNLREVIELLERIERMKGRQK